MMPDVLESFRRLTADYDLVLVEGAGSPAEINLRKGDIATEWVCAGRRRASNSDWRY